MNDEHTSFIKTPRQLAIVVVLAFAVPIALIVLLSQLVTGVRSTGGADAETGVLNRIKPVGQVTLADAGTPKGNLTGQQVYQQVCKTCHEAGLAGSPKFGDKTAWAPRLKQGSDQLAAHAISGTAKGMPPRGGNPDLTDVEIARAVVYMANQSGGKFKEPPAPAATAAAPSAPPASASGATGASAAVASASRPGGPPKSGAPLDMTTGPALMQKDGCAACHAIDKKLVGPAYQEVAAKYKGDGGAAARLAQKVKTGGAGAWGSIPMPPNASVSDDDVKALVAWILALKKE